MLIGNIQMTRNLILGIFPPQNTVFNYTLGLPTRNGKIKFLTDQNALMQREL